jgi:hypothetical protein
MVTVTDVSIRDRTVALSWTSVPDATGYVVQVGSASGLSDVATLNTASTTTAVGGLAPRNYFRVQAQTAAGPSQFSAEILQEVADFRDVVDALFFSRGPLAFDGSPRPRTGGWRLEVPIRVRISEVFDDAGVETVRGMVAQANDLMAGRVVATIVDENAPGLSYPAPLREIWVIHDPATPECGNAVACARSPTGGPVDRVTVIMKDATDLVSLAHEMGHALAGVAHLGLPALPTPEGVVRPLMGPNLGPRSSRFSPAESDAIRAVYGAGLVGGTEREPFVALGLVRP